MSINNTAKTFLYTAMIFSAGVVLNIGFFLLMDAGHWWVIITIMFSSLFGLIWNQVSRHLSRGE